MTTWAEHVRDMERRLAEPVARVCSCGAPSGSAHDHNTGRVLVGGLRWKVVPDYGCYKCTTGVHGQCTGKAGHSHHPCPCAARNHHSPGVAGTGSAQRKDEA